MKQDTAAENAVGRKRKGRAGYPGKDAAVISHAESLAGIERFSSVTGQRRAADTAMRGLLKNARFTGALLGAGRRNAGQLLQEYGRGRGNREFPGRHGYGNREYLYQGYPSGCHL